MGDADGEERGGVLLMGKKERSVIQSLITNGLQSVHGRRYMRPPVHFEGRVGRVWVMGRE